MRISNNKYMALLAFIGLVIGASMAWADPFPKSFEGWKTDFSKHSVKMEEILSGGPPKDGIPAIDAPKFIPAGEAKLAGNDPVIAFSHNGDARAYPLSILMWHEIANDVVGGHPFAVTYCPLCNAAIVFDAMVDGHKLDFGTTGRLRNSDLLMYDRQSESWWQQFSGEAIIGAKTGTKLKIVPSRLESFASFKKRFKQGKILVASNPGQRDYGKNPYVGYDGRSRPYPLYDGSLPENINPMARVVVIRQNGEAKLAIALSTIRNNVTLKRGKYHLSWQAGRASALDSSTITNGRDVGNLVVLEEKEGKLIDAVHDITFAFVVHAFHGDLPIEQ